MASVFYSFGDKNVFVLENHTQTGGFSEGGVYVGGTAQYTNYNVGTALPVVVPPNSLPRPYSLYVIGEMNITGGTNTQNSALSPSGTLTAYTMVSVGGITGQPLRVDEWLYPKPNLSSWLECTSYGWAVLDVSGTATLTGTVLTLTGTSPSQNIFTLDGDSILGSGTPIDNITQINLNVPAGATVLINVIGDNLSLNNITLQINGGSPTAAQAQKILFNFPTATSLTINSVFYGTILAPSASTTANALSEHYGTLFTNNLSGSLDSKSAIFDGDLPEISNPSSSSSCTYTTTTTTTTTSTTTTTTTTTCTPTPYTQAVNDLIESVALEQTGLAHILNAEGEKLQKAIQIGATPDQLIKINSSVEGMTNSIARLEMILQAKLNAVQCEICRCNKNK